MASEPLRTGVLLQSQYPIEREAIALLNAVPAKGERATFLRALIVIGYSALIGERQALQDRLQESKDSGGAP